MKRIIFILIFTLLTSSVFYSFRIKKATLWDGETSYTVKINSSIQSSGFNSIVASCISIMSPSSNVVNSPSFAYGGLHTGFNLTPVRNDIIEIGYGYSSSPTRAGATDDYTNVGVYSEFDILMTNNFAFTWGNGRFDTVSRETGLKHELGHGVGLDHTAVRSRLMYVSYGVNEIKNIGSDEINGYDCIYNNRCRGMETDTGNLDFSTNIVFDDNKNKVLKWNIETDKNSLIGFNIYVKLTNCNLKSINPKMIEYNNGQDSYSFFLKRNDNQEEDYYVEVIGEEKKDMRMFKFKINHEGN